MCIRDSPRPCPLQSVHDRSGRVPAGRLGGPVQGAGSQLAARRAVRPADLRLRHAALVPDSQAVPDHLRSPLLDLSTRVPSCPGLRARAFFCPSGVDAILMPRMRIAPARLAAFLGGGVLLLFTVPSCRGTSRAPAGPRFERAPVILISVDTLRSDRLPMYGYGKVEAPALDLSLIHISEPTRRTPISYAVFCLK